MIDDVSCMLLLQRSHREFHVFGQKKRDFIPSYGQIRNEKNTF